MEKVTIILSRGINGAGKLELERGGGQTEIEGVGSKGACDKGCDVPMFSSSASNAAGYACRDKVSGTQDPGPRLVRLGLSFS